VYEAPAIIGTCINCIAPGSLSATLAVIVIGAGIALTAERHKLARVRANKLQAVAYPAYDRDGGQ